MNIARCVNVTLLLAVLSGCATFEPQNLTPEEQVMWRDFSAYMQAVQGRAATEEDWAFVQYARRLSPEGRRQLLAEYEGGAMPLMFGCTNQRFSYFDTIDCY